MAAYHFMCDRVLLSWTETGRRLHLYADFFLSFAADLDFSVGFDSLDLVSAVLVSVSFFPVSL